MKERLVKILTRCDMVLYQVGARFDMVFLFRRLTEIYRSMSKRDVLCFDRIQEKKGAPEDLKKAIMALAMFVKLQCLLTVNYLIPFL